MKNIHLKVRILYQQIHIIRPKYELCIFGIYAMIYFLVVWIVSLLIKYYPLPLLGSKEFSNDLWYILFAKEIFLLAIPVTIYRYLGYKNSSLFLWKFKNNINNIIVIVVFFLLGLLVNNSYITEILNKKEFFNITLLLNSLLIPLFTAAIPEEIFYRVILQTRIENVWGSALGIIGSSMAFAIFHFPTRFILANSVEGNVLSVINGTILPVFIMGLIFGVLWLKSRNVYLLIAFHTGIDFLPQVISFLKV